MPRPYNRPPLSSFVYPHLEQLMPKPFIRAHVGSRLLVRCLSAALLTVIVTACSSDPAAVAEAFWQAGQDGDIERARSYVSASSSAKMNDGSRSTLEDVWVGESTVDGDGAMVETRVTAGADAESRQIHFNTIMVRESGDWKVDLDATSQEMMKEILGVTMGEFGEQMGEAMKGAMKGMAEGMAEGMEKMGEAMTDAARQLENRQK